MIYSNKDDNAKRYQAKRYCLPKGIIKNYNAIINGKLTTKQGEDYTTGCLLGYGYVKKYYRLIAVYLSRRKQLFVGQLQKLDDKGNATDTVADQTIFILTIIEKIQETRLKFSQGNVTVL